MALSPAHQRRLREIWRSAGWPCKDNLELDLRAAGLLSSHFDEQGRETLRLTDAGVQVLVAKRQRHQVALSAHEALVAQVALQQQRAGRLVWRGLSLRAALAEGSDPVDESLQTLDAATEFAELGNGALPGAVKTRWAMAMPDVYSIRHTTVEAYTEPVAHEIKVSRADLLSDLRRPAKAEAYRALSSQCWYVLRRGIAQAEEIPPAFGVMLADQDGLEMVRPAPARAMRLPFAVWMALARAHAENPPDQDAQVEM